MFRRNFLQLVTMASVGGLAPLATASAPSGESVTWQVKGFTCLTCATGLDTLLMQQKGIIASKSTYPQGSVTVSFHPDLINRQAIVAFISELGFTVESEHRG